MKKPVKRVIVIDGNALVHRTFHALPPTLTTKSGQMTNAVYGFLLIFLKVLEELNPQYIIAVFDHKGKTFRHHKFKEYKAQRKKAPDELYEQIPLIKRILKAFNVPIYTLKGVEADDLMGSLVQLIKEDKDDQDNLETVIVTGDLDALQLVNQQVKVFTLKQKISDTVLYGIEEVKEKLGVLPEQVIDYKALVGDVSDNIPGVNGIGKKTATKLLKDFKTLNGIYLNLENLPAKLKEKLIKSKDLAFLSQELATIKVDIKLDFSLQKARYYGFNKGALKDILQELEFFSLIKRLKLEEKSELENLKNKTKSKIILKDGLLDNKKINHQVFKNSTFLVKKISNNNVSKVFQKIFKETKEIKEVFLDCWERPVDKLCEKNVFQCDLKYLSLAFLKAENLIVYLIKFNLDFDFTNNPLGLKRFFSNKKITVFGGKFLWEILKIKTGENLFFNDDLKVMAYLINSGRSRLNLLRLAKSFGLQLPFLEKYLAIPKGQTKLLFNAQEETKDLENFLKERTEVIIAVGKKLRCDIIAMNLEQVYQKIDFPLLTPLAKMELRGIKIDTKKIYFLTDEYEKKKAILKNKIFLSIGQKFNLDSSQQLSTVFFKKLKFSFKGIKKGKSGFYSTSNEALILLAKKYPVADLIIKYRELTKLINTYLKPLPLLINVKTGRLHTQFNQEITATGRLSSSNPNLQNIPIKTPEGRKIRETFIAEEGFSLVSFDYSQIELRIATHYSKDKTMLEAFLNNRDIHQETASKVYGFDPGEKRDDLRRLAKELNFGLIYGMGVFGFAKSAGISRREATDFVKKYRKNFPEMFCYLEKIKENARKNEWTETLFGRRRYIPEINSESWRLKASAERIAVNMPFQGTAADIMKLAIIKVDEYLSNKGLENDVRILLTIHDELLIEIKECCLKKEIERIKDVMEKVVKLRVPLIVQAEIGKWGAK